MAQSCRSLTLGVPLAALAFSWCGVGAAQPVRWQAQYSQVYSDDIEAMAPILAPAFSLGPAGSLTSTSGEVIAGKESIKGAYSGSESNTTFLVTNPSVLPLAANHSYTLTFRYKVLTSPGNYFVVQFYSPTAGQQGKFLNVAAITDAAGTAGTATLTSALANYSDYEVLWNIGTTGAISIDGIQITDAATGKVIAAEDAEATGPTLKSGIQLRGAAAVADASQALSGKGSILLNGQAGFVTNPATLPLGPDAVYSMRFDYRILQRGTADFLFYAWFRPQGATGSESDVTLPAMLKNAETTGTFAMGAKTADARSYVLMLTTLPGVSIIIDNILVYREDVIPQTAAPASWSRLLTLPFPRLGNKIHEDTSAMAQSGWDEAPFTYTVAELERHLAFNDVIAGLSIRGQTQNPDSIRRIRALNPNIVILTESTLEAQNTTFYPSGSNIDLEYQLWQSTPNAWKAMDSSGNPIYNAAYPFIVYMNLSDSVPPVNGQTWRTALHNFVTTQVFPSGLWDGVLFNLLQQCVDADFPNSADPSRFDFDWNRNGIKDETLASTNEMLRAAKADMLQRLNAGANDLQLIIGNSGASPQFASAPLFNGYTFECFNTSWNQPGGPIESTDPASWRVALDTYLHAQAISRAPQINILEACGVSAADFNTVDFSRHYLSPTAQDLQRHRFSMGTALLGNGFYEYELKEDLSAPYWFDEYSVDTKGIAIEDRSAKGYLGHPLSDAVELATRGTPIFQEGFEGGAIPSTFLTSPSGSASVTRAAGEVISGAASLVLSNPDHTKAGTVSVRTNPAAVPLTPGTYLLTFDWRILETLDSSIGLYIDLEGGQGFAHAFAPGCVRGDFGSMRFPFTISSSGNWSINFQIWRGGGKVAIDNVKIYSGATGPWRRDFENGLVLVNPFDKPHTFTAGELEGALHRTGIRRIRGTQAPEINNGQPVAGELTVSAFDGIILLADRAAVGTPTISSVTTAGGAANVVQNGWIEIRGANLAPAGAAGGMTWEKAFSFESELMPTELGGVRVTVNGKPAFVYFASANQLNVLSPLDNTLGPVPIVVTSGGVSSAPFQVSLQPATPSFPLVGSTNYVVATHTDYSLVGPAALSAPGYTFTPARKAETIVLYAFGLGSPTAPLVNGSSTQNAPLPVFPQVQIGGATAVVTYAGVISPGLYQLNVTIPDNIPAGDNRLVLTYGGQSSPAGDVIAIQ
jgi:uncharacterized protein (TIGR03437 family)